MENKNGAKTETRKQQETKTTPAGQAPETWNQHEDNRYKQNLAFAIFKSSGIKGYMATQPSNSKNFQQNLHPEGIISVKRFRILLIFNSD